MDKNNFLFLSLLLTKYKLLRKNVLEKAIDFKDRDASSSYQLDFPSPFPK